MRIRKLGAGGDTVQEYTLVEGKQVISEAIENNMFAFDEDEKRIVTNATMGQLTEKSNVTLVPTIRGG